MVLLFELLFGFDLGLRSAGLVWGFVDVIGFGWPWPGWGISVGWSDLVWRFAEITTTLF